jgi:putative inorganic carbon (hco3(-)) transporter
MASPGNSLIGASGSAAATLARRCAYAFMLTMPWAAVFAERLNPHDVARMLVSGVTVFAAWAWWQQASRWEARRRWEQGGLLAIAVLAAASATTAARPVYAWLEVIAWVLLLMLVLVFARSPSSALQRELPPVLALAGLVSVVMELPRWAFFLADGRIAQPLDFGFMYMSARFFNHAQSVVLPLLLLPLLLPAPRWARVAAWIGLCGGLALLWRTGGRGTLIGLAAAALVLPWLLREHAQRLLRVLGAALLGATLVYGALFIVPAWAMGLASAHQDSLSTRVAEFGDGGRSYLWKRAMQTALLYPWLGSGPMHFAYGENRVAAHPHSSVLQLAAEWGLPATVLVLAAAAVAVRRGLRAAGGAGVDPQARTMFMVATAATLAGGVDSLVSGTMVMPVSQLWWCVALGVMLAARRETIRAAAPRPPWRAPLAVGLVAMLIALSVLTYRLAVLPPTDLTTAYRNNVPRYWINGFFGAPQGPKL